MLEWAVEATAPGGRLTAVDALREPHGPWKLRIMRGGDALDVVLKARPPDWRAEVACEIAALRVAQEHGLPAPSLVAADLSGSFGAVMLVCNVLAGDSTIPVLPTPERLRSAGAAAVSLHQVRLEPQKELPLRTRQMPWIDHSEERRAGKSPTTDLLDEVDARLAATSAPTGETVFVHGDLWQGNLLFEGDACVGVVDWEAGGAGDRGIDLGSLRWDAAILFGPWAAEHILEGYEAAAGRTAGDVAYWDVVAAANTPADLSAMVDAIAQQGRPDLDGQTLTARRDQFVETALTQLGR